MKKNHPLLRLIAEDNDIVVYRKKLRLLTGSVISALLLSQIIYWWQKKDCRPFYKFKQPPKRRRDAKEKIFAETEEEFLKRVKPYKKGDSFCEELGLSRSEFDNALKKIAHHKAKGCSEKEAKEYPVKPFIAYWTNRSRLTYYTIVDVSGLANVVNLLYMSQESDPAKIKIEAFDLYKETTSNKTSEITPHPPAKTKDEKSSSPAEELHHDGMEITESDVAILKGDSQYPEPLNLQTEDSTSSFQSPNPPKATLEQLSDFFQGNIPDPIDLTVPHAKKPLLRDLLWPFFGDDKDVRKEIGNSYLRPLAKAYEDQIEAALNLILDLHWDSVAKKPGAGIERAIMRAGRAGVLQHFGILLKSERQLQMEEASRIKEEKEKEEAGRESQEIEKAASMRREKEKDEARNWYERMDEEAQHNLMQEFDTIPPSHKMPWADFLRSKMFAASDA